MPWIIPPAPPPPPVPSAEGQVEIPHLAWPMALAADGTFATVEQDLLPDVTQTVNVLLNTPLGVRPLAPDIGVDDQAFTDVDVEGLKVTLQDQEPRAAVTINVAPGQLGEETVTVRVALAADVADQEV